MILIGILAALYLIPSAILQGIYGPSYGFLAGENCWVPDGEGDWTERGTPVDPKPDEASVDVPIGVRYIPIFLPGLALILVMFGPFKGALQDKRKPDEHEGGEPSEDDESAIGADDDLDKDEWK